MPKIGKKLYANIPKSTEAIISIRMGNRHFYPTRCFVGEEN